MYFVLIISFLSSVQVSGRTHHRSIQTSNSIHTLMDGSSLASHSSQHVGRHFHYCFLIKGVTRDVLLGPLPKSHPSLDLTFGCSETLCRLLLFLSLSSSSESDLCICNKSTSNVRKNGQVGVLERVYQNAISASTSAAFCCIDH